MKKVLLVLAIAFVGCSQQDDLPQPVQPVTTSLLTPVSSNENFEGIWDCYDWVVDDITGAVKHRRIMFTGQEDSTAFITMNEYDNGISTQIISLSGVLIDSNYFDNPINPNSVKFKGVKTSDSTLMVYQYYPNGLSVDTSQVKEFIKD